MVDAPQLGPGSHADRELAEMTAKVVTSIGETEFCAALADLLRHRAAFDSLVMLAYHYRFAPRVLFQALDPGDAAALYGRYFKDAYLLSPFYLRWRAAPGESDLYRLREIAPDGFFDSIYYVDYYARSGLSDELAYVIATSEQTAVLVSLGRIGRLRDFKPHERERLTDITSLVISAVQRNFSFTHLPAGEFLRRHLDDALALFGSRILTEREQAVAQLMLRGHSSKSCARALGISPTTERVHRRNIYAKLGISSQAELFARFFNAVARDGEAPEPAPPEPPKRR